MRWTQDAAQQQERNRLDALAYGRRQAIKAARARIIVAMDQAGYLPPGDLHAATLSAWVAQVEEVAARDFASPEDRQQAALLRELYDREHEHLATLHLMPEIGAEEL
jgi:hypothetical protein